MNDQHGAMRAVEPGEQHDLGARLNAPKPCRYVRLEYQPCLGRAFIRLSRGGRDVLQLRFDSPDRFDMDTHLITQWIPLCTGTKDAAGRHWWRAVPLTNGSF